MTTVAVTQCENTTAYLDKKMEEETGRGNKYEIYAHNDLDSNNDAA